jgi:poly-gamma-glutamate capsule biosynthesis protein CapA/YwtB (metallophosphatase superfamily)
MPMTQPRQRAMPARAGQTSRTSVLIASDWAPIRAFDPLVRHDPAGAYGDLLPVLRRADLRIVNCECALTSADRPVWKSGAVFKGAPDHIAGLAVVPFDVACLANNHVFDYGIRGFRETLRLLHKHGIRAVGAGLTDEAAHEPLTRRVNSADVHVVNVSEGEDQTAAHGGPGVFGWDIPRAIASIKQCRKRGGPVIVIAHCGLEYVPFPPPYVVSAFRAMADAGADAVVGHHPHVPQGIEWRGHTPIVYSLGNFLFYQQTGLLHRKTGFCVTLQFVGSRVSRLDLHPYRIAETGLRVLHPTEGTAFHQMMARLSRPFATPRGHERAWDAYLAYYGADGFDAEVRGILEKIKSDPQKGAAMFRNRVTTMQHIELWRTFLTRMMDGPRPRGARDAARTVTEYFTTQI